MPIVIVGAGGHGRGILEILVAGRSTGTEGSDVAGFLDDSPERVGASIAGVPVIGKFDRAESLARDGCRFLLGIGDPGARRAVAARFGSAGIQFATAVHPSAVIYRDTSIAAGSVIAAGVVIAANSSLGDHSLVNLNATIGHDCHLDAFATVGPGANLGGNVRLGRAAFVGMNATIVPGRCVGEGAIVGAGSVLLEDLPERVTAFGVPARIVQRRQES